LDNAYFGNCIFYGYLDTEIGFDPAPGGAGTFNYMFDRCLIKVQPGTDVSDASHYRNIIVNADPKFVDGTRNNFKLDTLSPAIDAADVSITTQSPDLFQDIDGNGRKFDPDLGAYERQ